MKTREFVQLTSAGLVALSLVQGSQCSAAPAEEAPTAAAAASNAVPPPSARPRFSDAELETLVAPIALYPDPVLAAVLAASVYPIEIVQAARFVKDTNNIPKVDQESWDDKVRTVAKMPAVIAKMDAELDWTVKLGQAFLEQPAELMNAMQALRTKAQKTGALKSTAQQVVTVTNSVVERTFENQIVYVTNTVIQVQPASPQVVYVPTYNPSTVYVEHHDDDAAAAAVVSFGVGMAFGAAMWGNCDWHYGGCYWGHYPPPPPPIPPPYRPPPGAPPPAARPPGTAPPAGRPPGSQPPGSQTRGVRSPTASTMESKRWQPDQSRLASSGGGSAATREARGWGGASSQPSIAARPSTGSVGARPSSGSPSYNRPASSGSYSRPAATPVSARQGSSYARPSSSGGSAFSGINSGSSSRSYSNRGAFSRGGGGFSGGGGRGGGRRR